MTTSAPLGASPDTAPTDADRVAELVNEYGASVYRLARSIVRDDALAQDVAQDTFIKVWKHLGDHRGEGSMRGWVLRIAHNTAVSTLRRVRDTATDPQLLPTRPVGISTERVVEGRAAVDELGDILDAMDEVTRAAIVLREVDGLSYDEIAEALGVPLPTVKTRLLRGRRQIQQRLDGWVN